MAKNKSIKNLTGFIMLLIVSITYVVLYFYQPRKIYASLSVTVDMFKMIIPILIVVFFLMALLNSFVKEKTIIKHLGTDSGAKGWIIALFAGLLSHGPGYVWYPMLQSLREKGALDGLIVAFLYARSIKIPWLPLMVSYFGIAFTVILTIYVIIGAFIQGVIVNRIYSE